jgi:hypothetical protein
MARRREVGWAWLDDPAAMPAEVDTVELCRAFANCFAGPDGDRVIDHLTRAFLCRRLAPQASDAELRHLEGQRSIVAHVIAMVERGRSRPWSSPPREQRSSR